MSKKVVSLLFVGIFLFLCLVPSVGLLLTGGAEAGANEVLAAKPSVTGRAPRRIRREAAGSAPALSKNPQNRRRFCRLLTVLLTPPLLY